MENIEFSSPNLSAVDFIEEVHEDKGVEEHCINFAFVGRDSIDEQWLHVVVFNTPHVVNEEEENDHDNDNVDDFSVDLSPHGESKNGFILFNGW